MQWVMKKRSYWEIGELLNPGVRTLIHATDPGQYCSPHTASSVFLLSVLPHARLYNYVQWVHLPMQGVTGDAPRPAHVGQQLAVVATVELGQHDVM